MPRKPMGTSLYSVHPAVEYANTVVRNLADRTGRSIDEWLVVLKKDGPVGDKEARAWLKKEHELGGTTANFVVNIAAGKGREWLDPNENLKAAVEYVEAMYAGKKAHLRPIHDALIDLGRELGKDVRICPCKTIVPLYRNHVFAEIKPATQKRIDFGLALKASKRKPPKRLIDTGGLAKGDRITHRFAIEDAGQIDDLTKRWLMIAYDLDA